MIGKTLMVLIIESEDMMMLYATYTANNGPARALSVSGAVF